MCSLKKFKKPVEILIKNEMSNYALNIAFIQSPSAQKVAALERHFCEPIRALLWLSWPSKQDTYDSKEQICKYTISNIQNF